MPGGSDVVVVGGGIIGLSVAWALAKEGATVTVLEAGQIGGQATGAAAGMLAPLAEAHEPGPFLSLALESLKMYTPFAAELHEESGVDPELIGPGLLRIAAADEDAYQLGQDWEWQQRLGLELDLLTAKEARLLEPALALDVRLAVRSPEERNVEPRRLVRALALACARRGVRIAEGEPVIDFEGEGARIVAALTPGGPVFGDGIVVAGGAWSDLLARRLEVKLPVTPVRGQILSLACLPPPIRHTVYGATGYLVPKSDGRVIVGATEDEAGFDARPTAGGIGRLLAIAPTIVPALEGAVFDSAWAGLRPATPDGLPILGRLGRWANVFAACGHFRNGILLTPITAEIVATEVLGSKPHPLSEAFRPDRFERAAEIA
ncbi:MAG TPA: glycine oxidase ThiO [Chthonomonadaceae bacterium]|nr:glycine oxidase ThiO [Chthonomonadaceae bacterium]